MEIFLFLSLLISKSVGPHFGNESIPYSPDPHSAYFRRLVARDWWAASPSRPITTENHPCRFDRGNSRSRRVAPAVNRSLRRFKRGERGQGQEPDRGAARDVRPLALTLDSGIDRRILFRRRHAMPKGCLPHAPAPPAAVALALAFLADCDDVTPLSWASLGLRPSWPRRRADAGGEGKTFLF